MQLYGRGVLLAILLVAPRLFGQSGGDGEEVSEGISDRGDEEAVTPQDSASASASSVIIPTLSSSELATEQTIRGCRGPLAEKGCRGPFALFLSDVPLSGQEFLLEGIQHESLREFEAAAKIFGGAACFAQASCSASPDICADHNALRIPAVIIYPPGTGAAQILSATGDEKPRKITREEIVAAVMRPIAAADKALVLTDETMETFLKDELRPLKLLLFSSRKTTPLILQALSSDPELWPHVRFGFVKHTETVLVQRFRVTEVPRILIRAISARHSSSEGWDSYPGGNDLSVDSLRKWIKKQIDSNAADPGEEGLFHAIEGASLLEEEFVQLDVPDEEEDGSGVSAQAALCTDGIVSKNNAGRSVCCAASCGSCGGHACGDRPGGQAQCCHGPITASGKVCNSPSDIGCVIPDEMDSKAPTPAPAPKPGKSRKPGKASKPGKPGRAQAESSSTGASPKKTKYKRLQRGAEGCPPGQEIDSVQECEKACAELGLRAKPAWISSYPGLPRYCSIRERSSGSDDGERMHFNSASEGQGREDLAPVCKVSVSAPSGASAGWEPMATEPVPQLNAASKDALFAGDGFCLVYLREGRISEEEVAMLMDLQKQFKPQLDQQGTKIRWMWMDLHIERKLKAAFDPAALPSVVVLNPHKRPRIAMVKHSEDSEGEPMPADQSSIALLLNTVLGGDAQFSPLPAKTLTKFAEMT